MTKEQTESKFCADFNFIQYQLIENAIGTENFHDLLPQNPYDPNRYNPELVGDEFGEEEEKLEWQETLDALEQEQEDYDRWEENPPFPGWCTVFEARSTWLSDKLIRHEEELREIGIYLLQPSEWTHACMFVVGSGSDFYKMHWIPLYSGVLKSRI